MTDDYQAPAITLLGSIASFTLQTYNKVGQAADIYTALTGGAVVGSVVPSRP